MDDMKANPMRYPRMKLKQVKVGNRSRRLSSLAHIHGAISYVAGISIPFGASPHRYGGLSSLTSGKAFVVGYKINNYGSS